MEFDDELIRFFNFCIDGTIRSTHGHPDVLLLSFRLSTRISRRRVINMHSIIRLLDRDARAPERHEVLNAHANRRFLICCRFRTRTSRDVNLHADVLAVLEIHLHLLASTMKRIYRLSGYHMRSRYPSDEIFRRRIPSMGNRRLAPTGIQLRIVLQVLLGRIVLEAAVGREDLNPRVG